MKVLESGEIRLAKNEKRIGKSNFFIKDEGSHMKIFDLGQVATHRALADTPLGSYLRLCYQKLSDDVICRSLQNYVAVLWTVCCVVPDVEFLEDVYKASEDCLKRHPDVYGEGTKDYSDEDDKEVIEAMRQDHELADNILELGEEEK